MESLLITNRRSTTVPRNQLMCYGPRPFWHSTYIVRTVCLLLMLCWLCMCQVLH